MDDLSKMLPKGPREKFIMLRDLATDRIAIARHAGDEMEGVRTQRNHAQIALEMYQRNPQRDSGEVARLEAQVAEAKAELQRLGENREIRSQRAQPIGQLVHRIEDYLNSTDPKSISLFTGPLHKRGKATPSEAVAAVRQEIEELTAKLRAIDDAPLPAAETKGRAVALIKGLAEAGAPEIDGLLAGIDEIRWPSEFALVGERGLPLINVPALLAFLFPDVLTKKIVAMIEDEAADQDDAIAATDRPKMKAQIHEALLLACRIEEVLVTEAAEAGSEIDRRGEADVRAVLGIVGPPPRDEP